jgi:hypothetical protein
MQGKGGDIRWLDPLSSSLRPAGLTHMAWHRSQIYDKTFVGAIEEITSYIKQMKSDSIAGHNLGR